MVCVSCSFNSFWIFLLSLKQIQNLMKILFSCIHFLIWPAAWCSQVNSPPPPPPPPQLIIMKKLYFILVNCIGWQVCWTCILVLLFPAQNTHTNMFETNKPETCEHMLMCVLTCFRLSGLVTEIVVTVKCNCNVKCIFVCVQNSHSLLSGGQVTLWNCSRS